MSQSTARRPTVVEPKGDRRRAALLAALDRLLDERALAEIAISEITSRAGVTRSAFYFYFSSKEAAAAELIGDIYADAIEAAAVWFDGDGENPQLALRSGMQASVEVGATFRAMERDVRDSHAGRATSADVAEALYEVWSWSIYREAQV